MSDALATTAARRTRRRPPRPSPAAIFVLLALALFPLQEICPAGEEPEALIPEVVNFSKLLPFLPEAPAGWSADKAEGSTDEAAGSQVTNVHRDYSKGEGERVPTTAISILDSAANPEYVAATTAAWTEGTSTDEGYSKPVTIEGNPGFEIFENDGKHGTLWLLVAKRYFLQIETRGQEAKELQDWLKRVDLKKLSEIK